ncbi:Uncharacterised protein [Salmonella enterica]|nr:Uncharacterised protein [Salmonella enterica]
MALVMIYLLFFTFWQRKLDLNQHFLLEKFVTLQQVRILIAHGFVLMRKSMM